MSNIMNNICKYTLEFNNGDSLQIDKKIYDKFTHLKYTNTNSIKLPNLISLIL